MTPYLSMSELERPTDLILSHHCFSRFHYFEQAAALDNDINQHV